MPVARYSSIECGIIGQQYHNLSNEYHLNLASYLFKILDMNSDKVLLTGNVGRIDLTDLYNYGMPFIRYGTGDIGAMCLKAECPLDTPVLSRIEGCKLDAIYNTSGQLINSLFVYKNMWKYTEINQYQLIQKGVKDYVVKICISGEFKRDLELITESKEYLRPDANFVIEYTNEIPLLNSGKLRKVINEYYNQVS